MQRDASLTIETERAAAGGNGRGVLARWRARAGRQAPCPLDHDVSTHLRLIDGEVGLTSLSLSSTQLFRHSGYSLCHSVCLFLWMYVAQLRRWNKNSPFSVNMIRQDGDGASDM